MSAPTIALTRACSTPEVVAQEWLIYKLVPVGFSVFYGIPKRGKTFFVLFLGMLIAAGRTWRKKKVKPRTLIYLYGEGGRTNVERRIQAIANELHLTTEEREAIPFFHARIPMRLGDEADNAKLADVLKQIENQVKEKGASLSGAVIAVDTVGRSMNGDENSTKDMAGFVAALDFIKEWCSEASLGSVWAVHHTNKEGKIRGNSSLLGGADCTIRVHHDKFNDSPIGKVTRLKVVNDNQKDGEEVELALELREFSFIGEDGNLKLNDEGEPITTCVVSYDDPAPKAIPSPDPPNDDTRIAATLLDTLRTTKRPVESKTRLVSLAKVRTADGLRVATQLIADSRIVIDPTGVLRAA